MTNKKATMAKKPTPLSIKTAKGKIPPLPQKASPAGAMMETPGRVSSSAQSAVVHRTTAEINVSEKHSLELAKTVMTATISTIASLRDIFPRRIFAIRTYDCADPQITYESFMNGSTGKFTFERSEDTLNWKILTRGSDDPDGAVNKLLDWIEISATDALEKKYLAKVQLSFHSIDDNEVSDLNLLEAYSICFSYENGLMHVATAEGNNGTANSVVLRGAKKDLYTLVNDVACMIQERDPLPGGRRMKMALLYNDTCPQDYEPPGFHADNNPKSLIASNKGAKLGSMNTGFHGISVNLFQQGPEHSHIRQLSSKRSRICLRSPSMSSEIDGGTTQEHGLRLLQSMGKYRARETQDTQPVNSISPQTSTRDETNAISQSTPTFLPYTQDVMNRIDDMRQQKVGDKSHQGNEDLDELHSSGRLAACECGALIVESGKLSGSLLHCDLCDNFKHIHCYGHLGIVPPVSKFACYSCLFEVEGILLAMKLTCVKRRALYYLRERGALNSLEEMAQHLDLKESITEGILGQLELESYVERTENYQKVRKGKGNSSEPLYTFVADDQKLLGHYFRPELDMGYYLALPASISSGNSGSPGRGNVDSQPNRETRMMSSTEKLSGPRSVLGHAPYRQTTLGDASSTEGTPSPNPTMARRLSAPQDQSLAGNPRLFALGGSVGGSSGDSVTSMKRPHDATPERELIQPILNQQGTFEAALDHNLRKRTKISIVNSPWTFRNSKL